MPFTMFAFDGLHDYGEPPTPTGSSPWPLALGAILLFGLALWTLRRS